VTAVVIRVMRRRCATCIYRKDSALDLARLEAQVRDKYIDGFFKAFRACHHQKRGGKACCRGFWDRHKNDFALGQIAMRFKAMGQGGIEWVEPTP
jgi:hypothetical protein